MLRHWTALVLILWAWGPYATIQDQGSAKKCDIQPNPQPEYVTAYHMHYEPGRGCFSNSSSPSHQLVHVINLKLDATHDATTPRSVSLKIQPKDFSTAEWRGEGAGKNSLELHQRVLVFVLNSQQPVKWKVEISPQFEPHARQRFLVQHHSAIRFKKRKARVNMRGRRRNMPRADNEHLFLSWVKRRFKAVTSYSEVDGDKLLFFVGQADVTSPECRLNEMGASPYAMVAQMDRQPVRGCIPPARKDVQDRPVYIIELQDVPSGGTQTEQRVELDILSDGDKKMDLDFYLILKSPPSVKWVLRSKHIQGWIDVVTDADADLGGIRMHTVALRRELIDHSGLALIRWAEYYIAPVRAYAAVSSANILQLRLRYDDTLSRDQTWDRNPLLPSPDSVDSGTGKEGTRGSATVKGGKQESDMRGNLQHIIHTQCSAGTMTVALSSVLIQELDLSIKQLSLLDRGCQATQNSTHVIFHTLLDRCNTRKMTVNDEDVYSNAIVIHASGMVGAILEEELGSGYFDLQATSGSGWMETTGDSSDTTYVDDEDLAAHKVEIDVECRVPHEHRTLSPKVKDVNISPGHQEAARDMCDMQAYSDSHFLRKVGQFPHTSDIATGICIQASATRDNNMHVVMENCWATRWPDAQTSDDQRVVLVEQGCTRSASVSWVHRHTGVKDTDTSPQRLVINRQLPHGSFLHCQLALCHKCPPHFEEHCNANLRPDRLPRRQTSPCGIHTVGPIEVIDAEVRIPGDPRTTLTTKPVSNVDPRSRGQGQMDHAVIIEGLDAGTVVGIAFAAFAIGILLTAALWFIHTHTGPSKRGMTTVSMVGTSGDLTPNSSSPISA
ncbi:transforming growth factor beta receptor type 3-like [Littorina saxatilis]|uniref:transforming growth factor beta receptor type 3-like n=1 Tax=Littorina saxatilis TaxID=31220 RepID=UPI0038B556B7